MGLDVTLLTARHWDAGGAEVTLSPDEEPQTVPVDTWGRHPALFVYDPVPLWRALREPWDVVDIHEEPFSLAAAEVLLLKALRRNRAPYVLYTAQNLRKRYPIPFRWLERSSLRHAAGISACNTEAALIAESKGFPGRARVIPLGVDVGDDACPAQQSAPANVDDAQITVGFIGRLVPEKGIDVLMDAVARSPRLALRIAGAGPLAETLAERAAARGIARTVRVRRHGRSRNRWASSTAGSTCSPCRRSPRSAGPSSSAAWRSRPWRTEHRWSRATPDRFPTSWAARGSSCRRVMSRRSPTRSSRPAAPRRDELRRSGFARAAECSWEAVGRQYVELYREHGGGGIRFS